MNKYVLTALLCPLLPLSAQTDATDRSGPIMGGYQAAPTDLTLVQEAKVCVQHHLSSMTLDEVMEAYTQVVAGLNIKLVCAVRDEDGPACWQFVVFKDLEGKWHLTSANRI